MELPAPSLQGYKGHLGAVHLSISPLLPPMHSIQKARIAFHKAALLGLFIIPFLFLNYFWQLLI